MRVPTPGAQAPSISPSVRAQCVRCTLALPLGETKVIARMSPPSPPTPALLTTGTFFASLQIEDVFRVWFIN
jgi:hypothetical protein